MRTLCLTGKNVPKNIGCIIKYLTDAWMASDYELDMDIMRMYMRVEQ